MSPVSWPELERRRTAWFDAPDLPAQKKVTAQMQVEFYKTQPSEPQGLYDQPTAFHSYLSGVPDRFPQFYNVKKST